MNVKKVMSLAVAVSMATVAFAQSTAVTPGSDGAKIVAKKTVEGLSKTIVETIKEKINSAKQGNQDKEATQKGNVNAPKTDKNIQGEPTSKGNDVAGKEEPTDNEVVEKNIEKNQPVTNEDDNAIGQDGINNTGDTFNPSRERTNTAVNADDLKGDSGATEKGEPTPSMDERSVADSIIAGGMVGAKVASAMKDAMVAAIKGAVIGAKGLSLEEPEAQPEK